MINKQKEITTLIGVALGSFEIVSFACYGFCDLEGEGRCHMLRLLEFTFGRWDLWTLGLWDFCTFALRDFGTFGRSDFWTFGLLYFGTFGLWELGTFGLSDFGTF